MFIFLITAVVIIIDQYTKNLIRSSFVEGDSLPIIQDFFHLTYIKNTGAAFSMLEGKYLLTIGIPIILIVIGLVFLIKNYKNMHITLKISVPLILGGGLGNLFDRIVYGYVVDMFDFRIFPIFNIADIAISVGCALLCIFVIFYDEEKGTKKNASD